MTCFLNQKEMHKLGFGSIGSNFYFSKFAQFYNASNLILELMIFVFYPRVKEVYQ